MAPRLSKIKDKLAKLTERLLVEPLPQQAKVLTCGANEILYGGAVGGGKSHLMRVLMVILCIVIPGYQAYLFRRKSTDLVKNHLNGRKGLRTLLSPLAKIKLVRFNNSKNEIHFWNGSIIYLCHCKNPGDVYNYQGAEIDGLFIDEITHFTEDMYRFLRGRVRSVGVVAPAMWRRFCGFILCSGNPGNIGHAWVKEAFIDRDILEKPTRMSDEEGGMLRCFIPAKMRDNPHLLNDDPTYEARMSGVGSAALVKALKEGDWNAIEGAYFDCWQKEYHEIEPFSIPKGWLRFTSYDHGYAKPFSVGWWAVSDGSPVTNALGEVKVYARGAMIRYREWYGKKKADVGLRLTPEQISECVKKVEALAGDKIAYRVADSAIFSTETGQSVASLFDDAGITFERIDKDRIAGWTRMRQRLQQGYLFTFKTCRDSIRTIPALPHSETRPEDLETKSEDHAADEWRYGIMSQPWVEDDEEAIETASERVTYNQLHERLEQQEQSRHY